MTIRTFFCTAAALLLALQVANAPARAEPGPPFLPPQPTHHRAPPRTQFVRQLAGLAAFEVAASRIALGKSKRPKVRAMAQKLMAHGQIVLAGLRATAIQRGGGAPQASLDTRQEAALDDLRHLGEPYLSVHYVQRMVSSFELMRQLVMDYARFGSDATEKRFAQSLLPRVRRHLRQLQRLEGTR